MRTRSSMFHKMEGPLGLLSIFNFRLVLLKTFQLSYLKGMSEKYELWPVFQRPDWLGFVATVWLWLFPELESNVLPWLSLLPRHSVLAALRYLKSDFWVRNGHFQMSFVSLSCLLWPLFAQRQISVFSVCGNSFKMFTRFLPTCAQFIPYNR